MEQEGREPQIRPELPKYNVNLRRPVADYMVGELAARYNKELQDAKRNARMDESVNPVVNFQKSELTHLTTRCLDTLTLAGEDADRVSLSLSERDKKVMMESIVYRQGMGANVGQSGNDRAQRDLIKEFEDSFSNAKSSAKIKGLLTRIKGFFKKG